MIQQIKPWKEKKNINQEINSYLKLTLYRLSAPGKIQSGTNQSLKAPFGF